MGVTVQGGTDGMEKPSKKDLTPVYIVYIAHFKFSCLLSVGIKPSDPYSISVAFVFENSANLPIHTGEGASCMNTFDNQSPQNVIEAFSDSWMDQIWI